MTKIALNHGATIDKYIGDAMMVFFGDPETKGEREDARACVEMALKMQERMGELREKWLNEGFADPFEVRIGINTGYCNAGNFGSDQRLTYTIIGGEVNVAARLESAAQANGILMSYETYAHVQDMVEVEQKEAIKMKGINREIKIYAVEGRKEAVNFETHKLFRWFLDCFLARNCRKSLLVLKVYCFFSFLSTGGVVQQEMSMSSSPMPTCVAPRSDAPRASHHTILAKHVASLLSIGASSRSRCVAFSRASDTSEFACEIT